jgi:tetratricopeptide (TPR) repeat protein
MRNIIIPIFLFLTFICSCSGNNKTASDWLDQEKTLWDGKQYTDPGKAIEYLNNAIKLQQNNAETYNKRGIAYYELGQYQRTIEDNSEAIRLNPDYVVAYNNRGTAYAKLGHYQKTIEDYNQVIRLKSNYADAYINRGVVYLLQDNKELGCSDFKKACNLGNCKGLKEAKARGYCR